MSGLWDGMDAIPLQPGIIYGPVVSRRLGSSLGINLLPTTLKICSYDCLYCQYGITLPQGYTTTGEKLYKAEEIMVQIETAVRKYPDVNYITFSGNGEATLHPDFLEIVEFTVEVRDKYARRAKTTILSNSSMVNISEVRQALMLLDEPIMKLDVGDTETFKRLNNPTGGIDLEEIIKGLSKLDCKTQTLFVDGEVQNSHGEVLEQWINALARVRPFEAQIYSLDRPHPDPGLQKVSPERLEEIAELAFRRTGVGIATHYRE